MSVKKFNDIMPILKDGMAQNQGLKYKRLTQLIAKAVDRGEIDKGRKLPPHRLLADELKVTIGTVSRAYQELERMGLVEAQVGNGTYVRDLSKGSIRLSGFRNAVANEVKNLDMSRNMPISRPADHYLKNSMRNMIVNAETDDEIYGYTSEEGIHTHRVAGSIWLEQESFKPKPEQIVCTNGAQHGLLCALLSLVGPGEVVATENLTYPGLISIARLLKIRLIGIELDEEGMLPCSLDSVCRANKVAAIFTTPTLQCPTTLTMSIRRREEIAKVCRDNNLIIIEDDSNGVLNDNRFPPVSVFASERSVILTSLSKVTAPGLRVGYIHAPVSLYSKVANAVRSTCWMASPFVHEVAADLILNNEIFKMVESQAHEVLRRKELVSNQLSEFEYLSNGNSSHFWIKVPEPLRAFHIDNRMKEHGYLIATSEVFAVGHTAIPQYVRASVCDNYADDESLIEAFSTLTQTLKFG